MVGNFTLRRAWRASATSARSSSPAIVSRSSRARGGAEHRLDERIELRGEPPALLGDVGGRNAGIVARREALSVGELDFELAQGLRPAVLQIDLDPLAQATSAGSRAFSAL